MRYSKVIMFTFALVATLVVLGTASPAEAGCDECVDDVDVSGDLHWFDGYDPQGMAGNGAPHGFAPGTCEGNHFWCVAPDASPELPTVEQLVARVMSADAGMLSSLIEAYPSAVTLNSVRQAVQVVSCGGVVAAHIPVTEDVLAAIDTGSVGDGNGPD